MPFVQWRVFIEVYILVFGLAYYLCTELQLISVLERQFDVCGYFQVLFHNVFLLLGQFFQLEVIAQSHYVSVEWLCERTALIAKVNVKFLLFNSKSMYRSLGRSSVARAYPACQSIFNAPKRCSPPKVKSIVR